MSEDNKRGTYVCVHAMHKLELACRIIGDCFGRGTYQVGSSLHTASYRDVDIRHIMSDEEFDAHFPGATKGIHYQAKLKFMNMVISDWLKSQTCLPIDFQFQRQSDANREFPTQQRNAIGILHNPSLVHSRPYGVMMTKKTPWYNHPATLWSTLAVIFLIGGFIAFVKFMAWWRIAFGDCPGVTN